MGIPPLGRIFKFARDTQDLHKLHETMKDTIAALADRLGVVEDRLIRLEVEQRQIVSEVKSGATVIAGAVTSDAVTLLARVEEGVRRLNQTKGQKVLHGGVERRRPT